MEFQKETKGSKFKVRINYFEIYFDHLIDLLSDNQEILKIQNNAALNAYSLKVRTPEELLLNIRKA